VTLGQRKFPEFFTSASPFDSPCEVSTVEDAAAILYCNRDLLQLKSGMVLAVPNPWPLDKILHDRAITSALQDMAAAGVSGKDATPFLLQRINEITSGDSLRSNIALIKHNAKIGAQLAVKLHEKRLRMDSDIDRNKDAQLAATLDENRTAMTSPKVMVIGAAAVDIVAKSDDRLTMQTSNIGHVSESFGGVARNIAECISNFNNGDGSVSLMSLVGDDDRGRRLIDHANRHGIDTSMVSTVIGSPTATYCAVNDNNGDLMIAVADMKVLDQLGAPQSHLEECSVVVVDGNVPLSSLVDICTKAEGSCIVFEPVSVSKAKKAVHIIQLVTVMTPNEAEVASIAAELRGGNDGVKYSILDDAIECAKAMHVPSFDKYVVVTRGAQHLLVVVAKGNGMIEDLDFPVVVSPLCYILNKTSLIACSLWTLMRL